MSISPAIHASDRMHHFALPALIHEVSIGPAISAGSIEQPDSIYIRALVAKTSTSQPSRAYQQTACRKLLGMMLEENDFSGALCGHTKGWDVEKSESGAPRLVHHGLRSELNISMAHSSNWISVALAKGARVGVDIEAGKPREKSAAMAEYMGWSNRVEDTKDFLALWTLWEACVKLEESSIFCSTNSAFAALEGAEKNKPLLESGPWAGLTRELPEDVQFSLAIHCSNQQRLEIKKIKG